MSILTGLGGLFGGKAAEKTVEKVGSLIDEAFYTDQEEAEDVRAGRVERIKLQIALMVQENAEGNAFIRLLQKLPRIIGSMGVVTWFVWNLWLFTLPTWAEKNGFAPYLPTGEMAILIGAVWSFIWLTRSYEKGRGVHNQ